MVVVLPLTLEHVTVALHQEPTLAISSLMLLHSTYGAAIGGLLHILIAIMLHAILLPSQIVVCKYVADTKVTDLVVRGTAAADATAKAAARTPLTNTLAVSLPADNP